MTTLVANGLSSAINQDIVVYNPHWTHFSGTVWS
jgi:hypothetical protein